MIGNSKKTRRARGFSLLELMLVLAIMGILMAVVAINVLGAGDKAKITATKATLKNIKTAMASYHLEYSGFPPSLQTLITTKYLENMKLEDGWKNTLLYDPNGPNTDQPYYLGSAGPDKVVGTDDDISVWTMDGAPTPTH
jgi:general secretion pathway protein G